MYRKYKSHSPAGAHIAPATNTVARIRNGNYSIVKSGNPPNGILSNAVEVGNRKGPISNGAIERPQYPAHTANRIKVGSPRMDKRVVARKIPIGQNVGKSAMKMSTSIAKAIDPVSIHIKAVRGNAKASIDASRKSGYKVPVEMYNPIAIVVVGAEAIVVSIVVYGKIRKVAPKGPPKVQESNNVGTNRWTEMKIVSTWIDS